MLNTSELTPDHSSNFSRLYLSPNSALLFINSSKSVDAAIHASPADSNIYNHLYCTACFTKNRGIITIFFKFIVFNYFVQKNGAA